MAKKSVSRGFTLIELMIVVAIIGILASIAVPNFIRFTARARQSEAKSNLKGFYTAAKGYYAEQSTYACGNCDFQVEQGNRYSYYWTAALNVPRTSNVADVCTGPNGATQAATSFISTATANIDSDTTCDVWTINQNNLMQNTKNDVTG